MQITYATEPEPTPGRRNEDFVVTGPSWVAVFDGATAPPSIDSGCVHGVAWLVRHLAAQLAGRLMVSETVPLADALAETISTVCNEHDSRCDLANPDSPSSTVVLLRHRDTNFDYLVLADSPLILDISGLIYPIIDDRVDYLLDRTLAGVRHARNRHDGFWVAQTNPQAAHKAILGSVPAAQLRRAALLTDGASRYVDRFQLSDWAGLLDVLTHAGPTSLIHQIRTAELTETDLERQQHRGKRHDDATAVLLTQY